MEAFIIWGGFILVGALIGKRKGRVGSGVVWAIVLGPLGWLVVALMKDLRHKCPSCAEIVKPEARICPHCRSNLGVQ